MSGPLDSVPIRVAPLRGGIGGIAELVTGPDPAAGGEAIITVPAGQAWRVLSFAVTMVTDATVTNRGPNFAIDDGTNIMAMAPAADVIPASTTQRVVYSHIGERGSSGANMMSNIPLGIIALAGWRLRTQTGGLQAGDNYGIPSALIERMPA